MWWATDQCNTEQSESSGFLDGKGGDHNSTKHTLTMKTQALSLSSLD